MSKLYACCHCGKTAGYVLEEGSTFRWWLVLCKACGENVAECRSDSRTSYGTPLPQQWAPAEEEWNRQCAYAHGLKELLRKALPIIKADAQMMADITRHAPLPEEAQAVHDTTEYESEKLVRQIESVLAFGESTCLT